MKTQETSKMPLAVQEDTNLFEQLSEWSRLEGWKASREASPFGFAEIPAATTPNTLVIEPSEEEKIYIEPRGYKRDKTAVFEMYAWPTLVRVRLTQSPGQADWNIFTDSGIPFHYVWNRETFARLAKDMLAVL